MIKEWSLTNLPPEGHEDVPEFFYHLFEDALAEQIKIKHRERLMDNHSLYRGRFSSGQKKKIFTPVNLLFANIQRTVANITANNPKAEVIDMDGVKDEAENIMTAKLAMWWNETNQKFSMKDSGTNQEIYGYTPEKPYWDSEKKQPGVVVRDPFTVIPAPGIWHTWDEDIPYLVFLDADYIDEIERIYGVEGVAADDAEDLMGSKREEHRPRTQTSDAISSRVAYGKYTSPVSKVSDDKTKGKPFEKGLIIEIWVRNVSQKTTKETPVVDEYGFQAVDPETGDPLFEKTTIEKYPDGIRKVTISKKDRLRAKDKITCPYIVLHDSPNPNINPLLPVELAKHTYTWGKFPCIKADSFRDTQSSYGFTAGEQTADLLVKISNVFTRLFSYVIQALTPFLVIERYCGIDRDMIETQIGKEGRLILMPTKPNADIRYVQVPNLPASFFNVLDLLLKFYDRIYQIEDADRGKAPTGIIAYAAIKALQERNGLLMQSKRESIEYIASERGKWAIGFWQNFGTRGEYVDVAEEQKNFIGVNYAGRRFNYQVEAESTMPRTSLQSEELAKWLLGNKLIDLRSGLEMLNVPDWKAIVERNGESQLDMALNLLIQAGLPKEEAIALKQYLMMPQGGPGDTAQDSSRVQTVKPGVPRRAQGGMPPAEVRGEG